MIERNRLLIISDENGKYMKRQTSIQTTKRGKQMTIITILEEID
jgi:hypothetical protein